MNPKKFKLIAQIMILLQIPQIIEQWNNPSVFIHYRHYARNIISQILMLQSMFKKKRKLVSSFSQATCQKLRKIYDLQAEEATNDSDNFFARLHP